MLKAWNTGHPGGVATIHANSAKDGLFRLEQLIGEVAATIPRAFDLLIYISGRGEERRVGPRDTAATLEPEAKLNSI